MEWFYIHIYIYIIGLACRANINIQFKLLLNWLSQISIMHLFHFRWRRLRALVCLVCVGIFGCGIDPMQIQAAEIYIHAINKQFNLSIVSLCSSLDTQSTKSISCYGQLLLASLLNLAFVGRAAIKRHQRHSASRTGLVIKVNMVTLPHTHSGIVIKLRI